LNKKLYRLVKTAFLLCSNVGGTAHSMGVSRRKTFRCVFCQFATAWRLPGSGQLDGQSKTLSNPE